MTQRPPDARRCMPARAWPGLEGQIDTTSGRATGSWTGHPRQVHPNEGHSFIACFAEDCEFNVPRRPGQGRDAVAAWWDFNATAWGPGYVRAEMLIESGETVV